MGLLINHPWIADLRSGRRSVKLQEFVGRLHARPLQKQSQRSGWSLHTESLARRSVAER